MGDRATFGYLVCTGVTLVTTELAVLRGITLSLQAILVAGGLLLLSLLVVIVATAARNNRIQRLALWPMATETIARARTRSTSVGSTIGNTAVAWVEHKQG